MKAEISKDGRLTVQAHTEVEGYALGEWIKHYNKGKKSERTLLMVVTDPERPVGGAWPEPLGGLSLGIFGQKVVTDEEFA